MVFWTTNMDFKGIVCFPNISAPIETEIPAWGFPFCSSGRQERPTEAPCPPTDAANAHAGLDSIAGIAAKKEFKKNVWLEPAKSW